MEKDDVNNFDSVLHYIIEMLLGERIQNLGEIKFFDKDVFQKIEEMIILYGLEKPPLLKISCKYTAPEKIEYEKRIFTGVPYPYLSLPPLVWHFYGGKPAPLELQNLEKDVRRNPRRFIKVSKG